MDCVLACKEDGVAEADVKVVSWALACTCACLVLFASRF